MAIVDEAQRPEQKTLFGHPRGLMVLFAVEMWERFSYYGMWGVLVFYLTWHFVFERDVALTLYGAFISLAYLAPLLGGYLGDRYIGFRKAVIIGGVLLVLGHGLLGLHGEPTAETLRVDGREYRLHRAHYDESETRTLEIDGRAYVIARDQFRQPEPGSARRLVAYRNDAGHEVVLDGELIRQHSPFHTHILFLALALIAAGVGFLKPNITTCVGVLYEAHDPRKDAGFTLYYMGINLGALLAAICIPLLVTQYGWGVGFGAAAVGMVIGLLIFIAFQGELEGRAEAPPGIDLNAKIFLGLTWPQMVYLSAVGVVLAAYLLLQFSRLMSIAMHGVFAVTSALLLGYILRRLAPVERDRMLGLLILIITSILFWTLFDQAPSSLNLFTAAHVNKEVLGWEIPAPVLQAINPIYLMIFSIPIAGLWLRLAVRGGPNVFAKFGFGMVCIGGGYFVLNIGIRSLGVDGDSAGRLSILFILGLYLMHTIAELCIAPIGWSALSKLAPTTLVSFMFGYSFFAISYANILAALVARTTQVTEGATAAASLAAYDAVYFRLGLAGAALGLLLLFVAHRAGRLTHGAD